MLHFLVSKKGYTFVEAMTVVVVLGILTAVAVPVYNISLKAKKREDCKNQRAMMTATVREVMTGMVDNGKPQDTIISLLPISGFSLYVNPNHIVYYGTFVPRPKLTSDRGLLEKFGEEPKKSDFETAEDYYTALQRYNDSSYNYYKDELKRKIKGEWSSDKDLIEEYEAFVKENEKWENYIKVSGDKCLLVELATIGDIRGNYRYAGCDDYREGCNQGFFLKKKKLLNVPLTSLFANCELPVCPFNEKDEKTGKYKYCYYIDCTGEVHCTCPECS